MIRKIPFFAIFLLCIFPLAAQSFLTEKQAMDKVKVMTLGTFHFDFPNKDVVQVKKGAQIDVRDSKHQTEIKKVVDCLAEFKPTIILVERRLAEQEKIDSLYRQYQKGEHKLERTEVQQIGFRLAKKLNLEKIHAVDAWGKHYQSVHKTLKDSTRRAVFTNFYFNNPDSLKKHSGGKPVFSTEGILAELIRLNQPELIKKSLGNYLIGHFKFEFEDTDYFGVDFETGRWFNRNLRIFRNIQRIEAKPNDRILLIIGAGHLNLLNIFFEASPEYTLISPLNYLGNK